jgi:preprotein translocase subunit SecG
MYIENLELYIFVSNSQAMINNFKTKFTKVLLGFFFLFSIIFVLRLMDLYKHQERNKDQYYNNYFENIDNLTKNYSTERKDSKSEKYSKEEELPEMTVNSEQKFEKTASLVSTTKAMDADEKRIKSSAQDFKAVIQYEQQAGLKGDRQLHLQIGVNPELFDSFYSVLQKIGDVKQLEVTKVDKTKEYRQLKAQKASIEKTLKSLNELKSRNGNITDFISLDDKIFNIEEKAQELGVELGNFDAVNEYCSIKLSLYERKTILKREWTQFIGKAFEWSVQLSLAIVLILSLLFASLWLLLKVIEKIKSFQTNK